MHVRQTTFTAIGVGAHSSVNDSTTYSAKDRQTMASYNHIENAYFKTSGFFHLFTSQDISYVVIIVPGRVLLWLCKPSWRYTQEMLQMQPWNRNIQLRKKVSLFPIQHTLGHLYCEWKLKNNPVFQLSAINITSLQFNQKLFCPSYLT